MNPKYRFDAANTRICFLTDEGETACSFHDAVQQIHLLEENLPALESVIAKVKERIKKEANEMQLLTAIQNSKDTELSGAFFSFLYESLHQYAILHNVRCVRKISLESADTYIKRYNAPEFEELADLLGAFGGTDPEFFPNELPSLSTIQAEVRSGDTYYSSELSVNAFLLMFRDVLRSVGLSVLECPVCGELFCGTKEDTCCGSADCRQYLETASPTQKKDDLADISRKFSNRVRKHRSDIREACNSAEAVLEFDAYGKLKQNYVTEKVKELRSNDAPVKEIRKLQKEVKLLYKEMNDTRGRIIEKYGKNK